MALASGVASPACLVTERGAYSLADWLGRMERHPSAARQKATLRQLLEAVTYLHGRGMARAPPRPPLSWAALPHAGAGLLRPDTMEVTPMGSRMRPAPRKCSLRAAGLLGWRCASAPARPASAVGSK